MAVLLPMTCGKGADAGGEGVEYKKGGAQAKNEEVWNGAS